MTSDAYDYNPCLSGYFYGARENSVTQDPAGGAVQRGAEFFAANMPKVVSELTDRFGNTFKFGNAGDFMMPPFPIGADTDYRSHAQKIRNLEIRSDDILVCSHPKTGLHWNMEIIHMLMNNRVQHTDHSLLAGFLERNPIEKTNQLSSPRILCTHFPFRHIPKQVLEKKTKVIYLDRNPKDVLVSYYNHMRSETGGLPANYHGTFEQFFYLCFEVGFYYGDLFDYLLNWQDSIEAHPEMEVYTSVFEDMKLDLVAGVKGLNDFLGTSCSDEMCEKIAEACSFTTMKAGKAAKVASMPESFQAFFKSQNAVFLRKGDVGDWKNWFTVAMDEYFDKEYNKRMAGYKRKYRFTLP